MPRVLVTRPQPAAGALAAALRRDGFDALEAPLMHYAPLDFTPPDNANHAALAFTSAAAVPLFAARAAGRDRPVFCVGDATAAAAREAGFTDVRAAGGDAAALAGLLAGAGMARVLHPCGAHRAQDMGPPLAEKGITLDALPVYEAVLAERLPDDAARALAAGEVGAVLLYSARAAGRFAQLAGARAARGVAAICLSPRVAAPLVRAGWEDVRVAPAPQAERMREILLEMGINEG